MNSNSPNPNTNLHLNATSYLYSNSPNANTTSYPDAPSDNELYYHDNITQSVNDFSTKEVNSTCTNFTTSVITIDSCEFIFDVIVTTFLCFVGFIGNSLTIAVLRRDRDPQRQKSTNWLLETLAIVDNIYLAFAFIFLPIRSIVFSSEALTTVRKMFPYIVTYVNPLAQIANIMAIWIVVLVTIDRYLAICKPLHPEWRSMRRVKMAVGVLFILAVIYSIPRFFEMEVTFKVSCQDGEVRPSNNRRALYENVYYQFIYEAGCDFVFRSIGPVIPLVIFNIRLFWTIKELNKRLREMTLQVKEEKTLTVMLIVVVTIFVICQLPFAVLSFSFPKVEWPPPTVFNCALEIANALTVLNSSINFFVYCLIWRKFNRILVRMMACCEDNANILI